MKEHKHKYTPLRDEQTMFCEGCNRSETEILFEEGQRPLGEPYGFYCWREEDPSQANAIKILEDIGYAR